MSSYFSYPDIPNVDAPSFAATRREAERSYRLSQVKAAVAIAAPLAPFVNFEGAMPPTLLVAGAADQVAPLPLVQMYTQKLPQARLEVLPGVHHFAFLPECNSQGRSISPDYCADPPGINRAQVHQQVTAQVVSHFQRHMPVK